MNIDCPVCSRIVDEACGYTACPLRTAALAACCPDTGLDERICPCTGFHYRGDPLAAARAAGDPTTLLGGAHSFDHGAGKLAERDAAPPVLSRLLHAAELARA